MENRANPNMCVFSIKVPLLLRFNLRNVTLSQIKITKIAWETKGVRSVKNAISIRGQSNFKSTAKDIFITSQLRSALIFNKKTKARNYTLETINKNVYIFGIASNEEEKKEVMSEANKIFDVKNIIPSIYLVSDLSRNKL